MNGLDNGKQVATATREIPSVPVAGSASSKVVFCHCAYTRILPKDVKNRVLAGLEAGGAEVEEVEDLCRMSAHRDPKLGELAARDDVKIAACYPRAVKWLFHAADTPLDETAATIANMREDEAAIVLEELLDEPPQDLPDEVPDQTMATTDAWKPWFPVIDFNRCTNCMQCLSFCLFDVYGVSEDKKIQVRNPTKCKTDCPACSRVCPEAAILFPKYRASPINGAEVSEEDLRREKMKVDISSLLGGDIYGLLRDRSQRAKSRFSKERDEERALKERKRCLKKLQKALDIPEELMNAMPSGEAILAKAQRLKKDG